MLLQAVLIWWVYWRPITCSSHHKLGLLKDQNTINEPPILPTSVNFAKVIPKSHLRSTRPHWSRGSNVKTFISDILGHKGAEIPTGDTSSMEEIAST